MLAELCQEAMDFCKEKLELPLQLGSNSEAASCTSDDTSELQLLVSLVHIDHMRSARQYIKTLERWVVSGGFRCGRLLLLNSSKGKG